jgi:hypothetical protein
MSLTLFALFGLPLCLKMVLDPTGTATLLKEWSRSASLQFISAVGPLMLAVLIFSTSKLHFAWSWDSVLSWMGILIVLKGLSHLSPTLVAWKMTWMKEERLPMFGFLGLLLLLAMVYIDTQLLK